MIRKLAFIGLALYFYYDVKKKLDLAIQDRNALLNFLTPEQRAQLTQGMNTASNIAQQGAQIVQNAVNEIR